MGEGTHDSMKIVYAIWPKFSCLQPDISHIVLYFVLFVNLERSHFPPVKVGPFPGKPTSPFRLVNTAD